MVIIMKRFLITILLAILTGAGLGFYAYNKLASTNNNDMMVGKFSNQVYALQVGVFDSINNANDLASKYGGIVINDNNKYRVYIAIVSNTLTQIKNYYDNKNISYYVKNIEVNSDFYNTLLDYESLLLATNEDNYEEIMKNILKEYVNLLNEV